MGTMVGWCDVGLCCPLSSPTSPAPKIPASCWTCFDSVDHWSTSLNLSTARLMRPVRG